MVSIRRQIFNSSSLFSNLLETIPIRELQLDYYFLISSNIIIMPLLEDFPHLR